MTLVIEIDNQQADFFEDADLVPAIYKRFIDFTEPFAVVGDYVLGLTLPSTSKNRRILEYIGNIDVNTPVFDLPHTARILLNNITLIQGQLKIQEYSSNGIKCQLIGDNISWASLFEGQSLRSIDLGTVPYTGFRSTDLYPNLNQTANTITALDVWKTFEADNLYTFNIPLIAYGNFPVTIEEEDNPDTNTFIGNPAAYLPNPYLQFQKIKDAQGYLDSSILVNNQIDSLDEFVNYPISPYLKTTVKQIFKQFGYVVNGEWINDPAVDNLLFPWTGDDLPFISKTLSRGSALSEEALNNWGIFDTDYNAPIPFNQLFEFNQLPDKLLDNGTTFISISSHILDPAGGPPQGGLSNQPIFVDTVSDTAVYGLAVYNLLDSIINSETSYTGAFGPGPFGYFQGLSTVVGENYQNSLINNGPYPVDTPWAGEITNERQNNSYFIANRSGTYSLNINFNLSGVSSTYKCLRPVIVLARNLDNPDSIFLLPSQTPPGIDPFVNLPSIDPALLNDTDYILKAEVVSSFYPISTQNPVYNPITYLGYLNYNFNYTGTIEMEQGETIHLLMGVGLEDDPSDALPDNYYYYTIDTFNVDFIQIDAPEEVSVSNFLPDIEILDFLKSIFNLFNLIPVVDESTKTVTLIPRPSYFLPAITAIDWSDKCSLDEQILKPINQIKNFKFQWAANPDFGYTQGDFDLTVTTDTLATKSEATIELIFSPTPDRTFKVYGTTGEILEIVLPSIADAESFTKLSEIDEITYNFNYRILKWNGVTTYENTPVPIWIGGRTYSSAELYGDPQGKFIIPSASFIDTGTSDFNLSYSNIPFNNKLDLYKKYWKAYIELILNSYSVTLPVLLRESDFKGIDIRQPVRIGNQLLYINLIDGFRPILDSTTKVEFIKKITK